MVDFVYGGSSAIASSNSTGTTSAPAHLQEKESSVLSLLSINLVMVEYNIVCITLPLFSASVPRRYQDGHWDTTR